MTDKPFVAKNGVQVANSSVALSNTAFTVGNTVVNSSVVIVNTGAAGNGTLSSTLVLANSTNTTTLSPVSLTIGTTVVNTIAFSVGGAIGNSSGIFVGANSYINASATAFGNSTVNSALTSTSLQLANSTSQTNVSSLGVVAGIVTVNTTAVSVGANVLLSATGNFVGNSTANSTQSPTILQVANSIGTVNVTSTAVQSGTTILNGVGLAVGANVTVNASAFAVGANVVLNSSTLFVGNSTVNNTLSAVLLTLANSTSATNVSSLGLLSGIVTVNTTAVSIGANVLASATGTFVGNSIANSVQTATTVTVANSSGQTNLNSLGLVAGVVTVNTTALSIGPAMTVNSSILQTGNSTVFRTSNSTMLQISDPGSTMNLSSSSLILGAVTHNTSGIFVGANTVVSSAGIVSANLTLDGTGLIVGNSTVFSLSNASLHIVSSGGTSSSIGPGILTAGTFAVDATGWTFNNAFANTTAVGAGGYYINTTGNFNGTAAAASNASALGGQAGSYYLALGNATGTLPTANFGTLNYTCNIMFGSTYLYSYGNIYAQGDVYAAYSDNRFKERLTKIDSALYKVNQLTGYYYFMNDLARSLGVKNEGRQVGLIAQDVQKILPEVVGLSAYDVDEEGNSKSGENYLTINYDKLVPLLVEAIKELSAKVEELERRL
jgi:hypothetical protein